MVYRLMNLQRFQSPCRNYLDTGVITLLPTRSALDFVNGYNRSMRPYCPIPDPSFPLSPARILIYACMTSIMP